MSDIYEEKRRFVENHVGPMLVAASEGDVCKVIYDEYVDEEIVNVVFASGHVKHVCVTGDSLKAIVQDVLKVFD